MTNIEDSHAMSDMPADGRRRVVIDALLPNVDRGRFAIKRIEGDELRVSAHVFADGHDELRVQLRHRLPGASTWSEQPMLGPDNDVWEGSLTLGVVGRHEYSVAAWVDHFRSWQRDLAIRVREDVVSELDLRIGAELVGGAAERATGAERTRLEQFALGLTSGLTPRSSQLGLEAELRELMDRHPDRSLESTWEPALAVTVDPPHARFAAWYELFPRSTASQPGKHGTFRDVIVRLDYVADLGFDVLYLPPVHPIGKAFRKGPNDSLEVVPGDPGVPWAIGAIEGGHVATHPDLGSLEDFDALVAAAAERDLRIALDLAYNASPDHPWVRDHRDWFKARPDGSIQYAENPPKKYQDVYPIDFESADWQALWLELRAVVRFWMDHGVRIFRVDNPHTKAFSFWEWLINDIKASDPDVIFLAEAFTRPKVMYRLAKLGFSQSYTYFTWRNDKTGLREYLEEITRPPVNEFFRPNLFTNTPDILHAYLQDGGRPAFEVRAVLAAMLGATYGIYGPPFELLQGTPRRPGSEEYLDSEKYQLRHWDLDTAESIAPLLRTLNTVRRAHPACQSDERLTFHATDDESILAFSKQSADRLDTILTVINLDTSVAHETHIDLGLVDAAQAGLSQVHELLTDTLWEVTAGGLEVQLDPGNLPAAVFHVPSDGVEA